MVNGLPDATRVLFDDERAVANAGVLLPAVLADRLGIEGLVDRTVRISPSQQREAVRPVCRGRAADEKNPGGAQGQL